MKITFTKGSGKYDRLEIGRADGSVESVECPKQRIIPHDMVHYIVESALHKRGFMRRVSEGEATGLAMTGNDESDGVERLVEVLQGDAWSGGTSSPQELLDLYEVTCRARDCAELRITADDLATMRGEMQKLDHAWQSLPVGGVLALNL
jgi:hypothetical protein